MCHADGTKQSSSESDLLTALDIQQSLADVIQDYQQSYFPLDVMATIVTAGNLKTIEELTSKNSEYQNDGMQTCRLSCCQLLKGILEKLNA